jgi:hypothetical protein
MSVKRVGRAAFFASACVAALTFSAGTANGVPPLDPPPGGPNNTHSPAPGGGGGGGGAPQAPPSTETHAPQPSAPQHSNPPQSQPSQTQSQPSQTHEPQSSAPQTHEPQSSAPQTHEPQSSAQQTPQSSASQPPQHGPQSSEPQGTHGNQPSGEPGSGHSGPPQSGGPSSVPANSPSNGPGGHPNTPRVTAPPTQPEHPPYAPRGAILQATVDIGGPGDARVGFSIVGQGAPPPPPQRGLGWNDGPAPGHAPPNWVGPPPHGGWDGPPPPGGWNRPWSGPPARDYSYAQRDYGAFAYNNFTVIPTFNPFFGGWGYWFFGVWIPLY